MTLDQLRIFVAVAEREHVTRAAETLHLTQSAVSAAIGSLEARHGVRLFHRVGRGISLTDAGRALLGEAREILEKVAGADLMLTEFGGLRRGTLRLAASQTVGGYWLPHLLQSFRKLHPGIVIALEIANSERVAEQVLAGEAELGFVEGSVLDPALDRWSVADDHMALVHAEPASTKVDAAWIRGTQWVLREEGSGTRSTFEAVLAAQGIQVSELNVALVLPSNEAVRTAAEGGAGAAVLSRLVVSASLSAGTLHALPFAMPSRSFSGLAHKQRYLSKAARSLLALVAAQNGDESTVISSR